MSRIGRLPITIPAGVTVTVDANNLVTVKGPKGTLTEQVKSIISVSIADGHIHVTRPNDEKATKALHGLYRANIANMIKGVTEGYSKNLIIAGVGYKAAMQGNRIVMSLGLSHQVALNEIPGIKYELISPNEIKVSGIDKVVVGQVAANIRAARAPEPYHLYGIHYSDEVLVKKEGKTAGK